MTSSVHPAPQIDEAAPIEEGLLKFYQRLEEAEQEMFATPAVPNITPEEMCAALADAAQSTGLPAPFFARLIWQESRFDPQAVSPAGAQGVAQFMPKVAAAMGLDNPFDPLAALPTSAQLLRTLYRSFGNLGLAAAAYNAGPKRIQDWLARRGKLPEETRNYVRIITGHPPERWTIVNSIDMPIDLPARAPCHGIAGMSRSAGVTTIPVRLDASVIRLIEEAKAAAKRAKAAKARRAIKTARAANAAKAKHHAPKDKSRTPMVAKSQERAPAAKEKYASASAKR
jgi:hypothetical protein